MNEIDALDRGLRRSGQTVTLRCLPATDVVCLAVVRGYSPQELISGIMQSDSKVTISPTPINAAGWPGVGQSPIPSRNRGDTVFINGSERTVQAGVGIYVQDVLVRIELQVR